MKNNGAGNGKKNIGGTIAVPSTVGTVDSMDISCRSDLTQDVLEGEEKQNDDDEYDGESMKGLDELAEQAARDCFGGRADQLLGEELPRRSTLVSENSTIDGMSAVVCFCRHKYLMIRFCSSSQTYFIRISHLYICSLMVCCPGSNE